MKLIKLGRTGKVAKVDDKDYERLNEHKWTFLGGYACRHAPYVSMAESVIGTAPEGMEIHHKDSDKLNNQSENLEHVKSYIHRQTRNSWSRYLGVHIHGYKFRGQVKKAGKIYRTGVFESIEDAARARDKIALELFGPDVALNFPL